MAHEAILGTILVEGSISVDPTVVLVWELEDASQIIIMDEIDISQALQAHQILV